jgi:hypothetical protein
MSTLTDLPEDVLKLMMQHVPLKDRMTSCCLVSRRLHAAAVAATHTLKVAGKLQEDPSQYATSVLVWISQYGQHLTRLVLSGFLHPSLQQLLCQNLQELEVHYPCRVQLGPSEGYPGLIKGNKLTRLELQCYAIIDARLGAAVDSLSSLVHLQHLHMVQDWGRWKVGGLSRATLPRLQHLTYLKVMSLSTENVLQLAALTDFAHCDMKVSGQLLPFCWAGCCIRAPL